MIEKTGRTVELSEFENTRRKKLKCPPIEENPENIVKILEETGVQKDKQKTVDNTKGED